MKVYDALKIRVRKRLIQKDKNRGGLTCNKKDVLFIGGKYHQKMKTGKRKYVCICVIAVGN